MESHHFLNASGFEHYKELGELLLWWTLNALNALTNCCCVATDHNQREIRHLPKAITRLRSAAKRVVPADIRSAVKRLKQNWVNVSPHEHGDLSLEKELCESNRAEAMEHSAEQQIPSGRDEGNASSQTPTLNSDSADSTLSTPLAVPSNSGGSITEIIPNVSIAELLALVKLDGNTHSSW
jgi:hypothetical protein